jgi:hypothetical protein
MATKIKNIFFLLGAGAGLWELGQIIGIWLGEADLEGPWAGMALRAMIFFLIFGYYF